MNDKLSLLKYIIFSLSLVIASFVIANSLQTFKAKDRTVTVKGLAEKEVKSDFAIWRVTFENKNPNIADVRGKYLVDKKLVLDFLKNKGFKDEEISLAAPILEFEFVQVSPNLNQKINRLLGEVVIKTNNVDLVSQVASETDQLWDSGVTIVRERYDTNPRYVLKDFNNMRPEMIALATESARKMAQQFANDSGTNVGSIRSADQGTIIISGIDNDYNEQASIYKKLRVVSHITYSLGL